MPIVKQQESTAIGSRRKEKQLPICAQDRHPNQQSGLHRGPRGGGGRGDPIPISKSGNVLHDEVPTLLSIHKWGQQNEITFSGRQKTSGMWCSRALLGSGPGGGAGGGGGRVNHKSGVGLVVFAEACLRLCVVYVCGRGECGGSGGGNEARTLGYHMTPALQAIGHCPHCSKSVPNIALSSWAELGTSTLPPHWPRLA